VPPSCTYLRPTPFLVLITTTLSTTITELSFIFFIYVSSLFSSTITTKTPTTDQG
jgi:hypothetical protein